MNNSIKFIIILLCMVAVMGSAAYYLVTNVVDTVANSVDQAASSLASPVNELSTQAAEMLHPTPTIKPDPITIVYEVKALARLETIQYSVEKVITAEVGQGLLGGLFGDRLLFVAHGVVIAGVDLNELTEENVSMEGDTVYIALPPAEVFIATLDNDKSYIYDRDTGLLKKSDQNLETSARQVAEQEILKAALEDGILEQAQANAEAFLYRLISDLGFQDVVFLEPEPVATSE